MEVIFILLCSNVAESPDIYDFIESHNGLISTVIVIGLFGLERTFTYIYNKNQTKREWYVTVIVNPNLKCITSFYEHCTTTVLQLKEKNIQGMTISEFKKLKKTTTIDFKTQKREFTYEFIDLVRSVSSDRASSLRECISELDDLMIEAFNIDKSDTFDVHALVKGINSNKTSFFSELFREIK